MKVFLFTNNQFTCSLVSYLALGRLYFNGDFTLDAVILNLFKHLRVFSRSFYYLHLYIIERLVKTIPRGYFKLPITSLPTRLMETLFHQQSLQSYLV